MRARLRTLVSHRGISVCLALGVSSFLFVPVALRPARAADADLVKRGEYLATAGDCVACHTAPDGPKLAGGLYLKTPIGDLSTPNITPDKETGIGNYTDEQFYRAMHEGIDNEGEYLYPAFPFPWYTKITKEDVLAIKAYLFSLKPVHAPRKEIKVAFPYNIRTGLLTWRTLFFKAATFKPNPKDSDEVNRGAYLVEGLGHCGECHNKSNYLGASVWSGKLQGGKIEGWYAPNITSDGKQGVGNWKKEEIVAYLKTGSKPDHTSVAQGPMRETIDHSLSKLSDADLNAMAAYLKSTVAKQSISEAESSKGAAIPVSSADAYLTHCSGCHQTDGKGIKGAVPALAGNGAVTAKGPENVIRAAIGGVQATNGLGPMPAVGQNMTDDEVAQAVNYVRSSWGNTAPANTGAGAVAAIRKETSTMLAMDKPTACEPLDEVVKDPPKQLSSAIDSTKDKLEAMNAEDMLTTINEIVPAIKKQAPAATPDQIANALTSAYCPIAMEKVKGDQKPVVLGSFANLVYGQARNQAKQ